MSTDGGIFISYRRIDTNWAAVAMRQHFQRELPGAPLFMDITDIEPGVDFRDAIRARVDRSKVVLAVIGPNWLTVQDSHGRRRLDNEHDWVRIEIARGLERAALGKARVIPVLIDGTRMPEEASLPGLLKPLSFLNAVSISFASNARDLEDLTGSIARLIPQAKRGPSPVSPPPPAATTGAEADIATAIADAMEVVGTDPRTMAIYAIGQSEAGKYVASQAVMERALSKLLAERESDDPDVLTARHNIAHALLAQGKTAEAEAALRDLLPLAERVQGPEHPDTLATRHELARALLNQGKAAEAEAAFRDLLPLTERVQGQKHPHSLATRRQLTRATLEQGAAEQAREALSALPDGEDQPPAAKAHDAMLRGWLADLDGERQAADTLLDQADALLSHLDPAHYLHRDLARYRSTRGPDGKGGTTIAAEFTEPS